jgi:hypothetical protein
MTAVNKITEFRFPRRISYELLGLSYHSFETKGTKSIKNPYNTTPKTPTGDKIIEIVNRAKYVNNFDSGLISILYLLNGELNCYHVLLV